MTFNHSARSHVTILVFISWLASSPRRLPLPIATFRDPSDSTTMAFTCFPNLPPELRLHIWELALPGPRVLKLINIGDHTRPRSFSIRVHTQGTDTDTTKALYRTCKDSHDVVKKKYEFPLAKHLTGGPLPMNPSVDILYFDDRGGIGRFLETGVNKLNGAHEFRNFKILAVPIPMKPLRAPRLPLAPSSWCDCIYKLIVLCSLQTLIFTFPADEKWTPELVNTLFRHFRHLYQTRGPALFEDNFNARLLDGVELKIMCEWDLVPRRDFGRWISQSRTR